jgi:hypothetical protein
MHRLVDAVGVEQMQAAFAAADANLTAYPGAGARETVPVADDWRRFIDLIEPLSAPDPPALEAAISKYVTTTLEAQQLAKRDEARAQYRALLVAGAGWLPPWTVRASMGSWSFGAAETAMTDATAVLALRAQVDAAAQALGLHPDAALRAAYESGKDGLPGATIVAEQQLDALGAIADAKAKVEAPPDFVSQIGLLGVMPAASYESARTAFEAGRLADAVAAGAQATSLIVGAAAIGQQRLVIAGITAGITLLVLFALIVLMRRRRRRSRALAVTTGPAPSEAYGTLAPDPAPDHDEGGEAPG